jgi:organic hydroperoxide reductase OsmC/OhrA
MQEFQVEVKWQGSTLGDYSRNATANIGGKPAIPLSASPSYGGDASSWNPEDLLGASLSMCHLLTFLALAHKSKLDVLSYQDNTRVVLDTKDRVTRVTQIILSPDIQVAADSDVAKVGELFQKAHKFCFIGHSITSEVVMTPNITAGAPL